MSSKNALTELPRLTSSLRAFSGLSSPYLADKVYGDSSELQRKREWKKTKERKEEFSWQDLNRLVKKNVVREKTNEVK